MALWGLGLAPAAAALEKASQNLFQLGLKQREDEERAQQVKLRDMQIQQLTGQVADQEQKRKDVELRKQAFSGVVDYMAKLQQRASGAQQRVAGAKAAKDFASQPLSFEEKGDPSASGEFYREGIALTRKNAEGDYAEAEKDAAAAKAELESYNANPSLFVDKIYALMSDAGASLPYKPGELKAALLLSQQELAKGFAEANAAKAKAQGSALDLKKTGAEIDLLGANKARAEADADAARALADKYRRTDPNAGKGLKTPASLIPKPAQLDAVIADVKADPRFALPKDDPYGRKGPAQEKAVALQRQRDIAARAQRLIAENPGKDKNWIFNEAVKPYVDGGGGDDQDFRDYVKAAREKYNATRAPGRDSN